MILDYALPKTGHPNCRRPDKVIDAGQHEPICTEIAGFTIEPLAKVWVDKLQSHFAWIFRMD